MSDEVTFDKPSYLCDESAWVRALDYAMHAESIPTFKKRLAEWLPYFPDAAKQIDAMGDRWREVVREVRRDSDAAQRHDRQRNVAEVSSTVGRCSHSRR